MARVDTADFAEVLSDLEVILVRWVQSKEFMAGTDARLYLNLMGCWKSWILPNINSVDGLDLSVFFYCVLRCVLA